MSEVKTMSSGPLEWCWQYVKDNRECLLKILKMPDPERLRQVYCDPNSSKPSAVYEQSDDGDRKVYLRISGGPGFYNNSDDTIGSLYLWGYKTDRNFDAVSIPRDWLAQVLETLRAFGKYLEVYELPESSAEFYNSALGVPYTDAVDIHTARAQLEGISRSEAKNRNFVNMYGGTVTGRFGSVMPNVVNMPRIEGGNDELTRMQDELLRRGWAKPVNLTNEVLRLHDEIIKGMSIPAYLMGVDPGVESTVGITENIQNIPKGETKMLVKTAELIKAFETARAEFIAETDKLITEAKIKAHAAVDARLTSTGPQVTIQLPDVKGRDAQTVVYDQAIQLLKMASEDTVESDKFNTMYLHVRTILSYVALRNIVI